MVSVFIDMLIIHAGYFNGFSKLSFIERTKVSSVTKENIEALKPEMLISALNHTRDPILKCKLSRRLFQSKITFNPTCVYISVQQVMVAVIIRVGSLLHIADHKKVHSKYPIFLITWQHTHTHTHTHTDTHTHTHTPRHTHTHTHTYIYIYIYIYIYKNQKVKENKKANKKQTKNKQKTNT